MFKTVNEFDRELIGGLWAGFFFALLSSMKMQFHRTSLIILILSLFTLSVQAEKKCSNVFQLQKEKTKPVELSSHFTENQGKPLSEIELSALSKHRIYKLKNELSDGQGITFAGMFIDVESTPQYKGEWIFTQEALRFLKVLFPKAKFVNSKVKVPKHRKRLELLVMDSSEAFSKKYTPVEYDLYITQGGSLPIPLMKPLRLVNPSASKEELRSRFGIKPRQKVLSLYVRAPDTMTAINRRLAHNPTLYGDFFRNLKKSFDFDVVILTFGNQMREGYEYTQIPLVLRPQHTIKWYEGKDITGENLQNGTIVVNATHGLLAHIHKAADLAVVIGPINFFEPLAVGTPTLIYKKANAESRNSPFGIYDDVMYSKLISIAMKTGLAETTGDIQEIEAATANLIQRTHQRDFKPTSIQAESLPDFLDALEKHIKFLLIHGKTPDPSAR